MFFVVFIVLFSSCFVIFNLAKITQMQFDLDELECTMKKKINFTF